MVRLCLILLSTCLALCAPAASSGYNYPIGSAHYYVYTMQQDVSWASADDTLTFTTSMRWGLSLQATAQDEQQLELALTIISITAEHQGPGSSHSFTSDQPTTHDDLLFGDSGDDFLDGEAGHGQGDRKEVRAVGVDRRRYGDRGRVQPHR